MRSWWLKLDKDINYYLKLKYIRGIEEIEEDGELLFKLSYIELPGLVIYADDLEEGLVDLEDAKKEWFATAIKSGAMIPLSKP